MGDEGVGRKKKAEINSRLLQVLTRIAYREVMPEEDGKPNSVYSLGTHFITSWPRSSTEKYVDMFKKWKIIETWQLPGDRETKAYRLTTYGMLLCHKLAIFANDATLNDQCFLWSASYYDPLFRKLLSAFIGASDFSAYFSVALPLPLSKLIRGKTIFKDPLYRHSDKDFGINPKKRAKKEEDKLAKVRQLIFNSQIPSFALNDKGFWQEEFDELILNLSIEVYILLSQEKRNSILSLSPAEQKWIHNGIMKRIEFLQLVCRESNETMNKLQREAFELQQLISSQLSIL
ncbi:MAG: hypothetical protein ABSF36_03160 [Candidatus Methanomethylicaceae archaeon]|jgi:hypothetical protein